MGLKCDSNAPATKGQLRQLAGFVELPLTQLGWTNAESHIGFLSHPHAHKTSLDLISLAVAKARKSNSVRRWST